MQEELDEPQQYRQSRWPFAEPDPDGDDLRGRDDLHRPDDRLDRRAHDPARPGPVVQRHAVGDQRLPAGPGGPVRVRRPPGGHRRAPQDGRPRGDHLRGSVRAVQGVGGAIMFPAAIAIVVVTFDLRSRGRALALFFGIAGALTAIGPIAGGYLIQWTWRSIFWINIPIALIALALIAISKPPNESRPAPMDYRGLALIIAGVGLSVFGFQQSALWGWGNPAIWATIAIGVALLIVFYAVEARTDSPLINVRIFR